MLFHSHNPKQKQNQEMARSRAKKRSKQSQTCVKYRGNIIFIRKKIFVNTGNLKILHKKCQNKVDFSDNLFNFSKMLFVLLWVLSSHNNLSVTHSDTASYPCQPDSVLAGGNCKFD